jgi:hypothetical protein
MKKILYICNQNPFDNSYGPQQRTSLLCDALCEKGQVDLVCFTLETLPQTISRPNCTVKYFGELQTKVHSRIFSRLKNYLTSSYLLVHIPFIIKTEMHTRANIENTKLLLFQFTMAAVQI